MTLGAPLSMPYFWRSGHFLADAIKALILNPWEKINLGPQSSRPCLISHFLSWVTQWHGLLCLASALHSGSVPGAPQLPRAGLNNMEDWEHRIWWAALEQDFTRAAACCTTCLQLFSPGPSQETKLPGWNLMWSLIWIQPSINLKQTNKKPQRKQNWHNWGFFLWVPKGG